MTTCIITVANANTKTKLDIAQCIVLSVFIKAFAEEVNTLFIVRYIHPFGHLPKFNITAYVLLFLLLNVPV